MSTAGRIASPVLLALVISRVASVETSSPPTTPRLDDLLRCTPALEDPIFGPQLRRLEARRHRATAGMIGGAVIGLIIVSLGATVVASVPTHDVPQTGRDDSGGGFSGLGNLVGIGIALGGVLIGGTATAISASNAPSDDEIQSFAERWNANHARH